MTARVAVPVTAIGRGGVAPATPTTGDPTNNHSVANTNSNVILLVANSDSASHTVTIHLSETVDGQAVTSRTVAIPATNSRYFGSFPAGQYGSTLLVDVNDTHLVLSAYSVG